MEYFWKENKKFVLAVGGGFIFVLLYYSFVLGPIRDGAALAVRDRTKAKQEIERRMQQGVPNEEGLVAARKDRDQNKRMLAKLPEEVGFTLPDRFTIRKGDKNKDLTEYYQNLKLDLLKELQKKSIEGKLIFPQQVGLPDEIGEDNAAEVLARLAIV